MQLLMILIDSLDGRLLTPVSLWLGHYCSETKLFYFSWTRTFLLVNNDEQSGECVLNL